MTSLCFVGGLKNSSVETPASSAIQTAIKAVAVNAVGGRRQHRRWPTGWENHWNLGLELTALF